VATKKAMVKKFEIQGGSQEMAVIVAVLMANFNNHNSGVLVLPF